eukprot:2128254-Amphidinium_carterae.1
MLWVQKPTRKRLNWLANPADALQITMIRYAQQCQTTATKPVANHQRWHVLCYLHQMRRDESIQVRERAGV